jgi:hypothetical protein
VTPEARQEGVVAESLDGELLIYDIERRRLHWLSPIAARVWKLCDGETSVAKIAHQLAGRSSDAAYHDLTSVALWRLASRRLLVTPDKADVTSGPGAARRLARNVKESMLCALEPKVISVTLQQVVHAESVGSCRGAGERCGVALPPCCPSLRCRTGVQPSGVCIKRRSKA